MAALSAAVCSQTLAAASAPAARSAIGASSFTGATLATPSPAFAAAKAPRWTATRAASDEECNDPTCAPEKEVGKVSMDWEIKDRTQVKGTYPPGRGQAGINPATGRQWGYTTFDSAGQRNIYPVEPTIYVSDNVFSSNSGSDQGNGGLVLGGALAGLAIFGAAITLSSLSGREASSPPLTISGTGADETAGVTVPPLSFYIEKFQAASVAAPAVADEPASSVVEAVEEASSSVVESV